MIRRETPTHFLLITQNDHAILAGQLAQLWGNSTFAKPLAPAIEACALHDSGWPLHDDHPTLNPNHQPLDVFESPTDIALKVWTASADRAQSAGDYAALLVSLHILRLSTYPSAHPRTRREDFLINQFQHIQVEYQEQLRKKLNLRTDLPLHFGLAPPNTNQAEDQLNFDFSLLQATDRISLALCCTKIPIPKVQDIYTQPGAPPIHLTLARSSSAHVQITPWPFDTQELEFQVPTHPVPARKYESPEDLQQVYDKAHIEPLTVTIRE